MRACVSLALCLGYCRMPTLFKFPFKENLGLIMEIASIFHSYEAPAYVGQLPCRFFFFFLVCFCLFHALCHVALILCLVCVFVCALLLSILALALCLPISIAQRLVTT